MREYRLHYWGPKDSEAVRARDIIEAVLTRTTAEAPMGVTDVAAARAFTGTASRNAIRDRLYGGWEDMHEEPRIYPVRDNTYE